MNARTRTTHLLLILIIGLYVVLGIAYAVHTPTWQVPDEPAHFNYISDIASTGRLPTLDPGDYPAEYLEKIKAKQFPPSMSIDGIDYEAHQPPLYYLLATPVYMATASLPTNIQVTTLRLISVVAGAVLLYLVYQIVQVIFPDDETLALTTTSLVAFIPMHITMTAAVNNDTLAELFIAGILLIGLLRLNGQFSRSRFVIMGGALYGLGLLTKTAVYPTIVILLLADFGYWWMAERRRLSPPWRTLFLLGGIAVGVSAWWFVRNAVVYGGLDIFGLGRHDAVVVGQYRTSDWIADHGWTAYWDRAWNFTFKSFWGVFGWMGVFMDQRIYIGLMVLTAVAVAGFGVFLIRARRDSARLSRRQRASLGMLAVSLILTLSTYVWYNLTFVQHQGRYLFPALVPIALFAALGIREVTPRAIWPLLPAVLIVGLVALDVISLVWFIIPNL